MYFQIKGKVHYILRKVLQLCSKNRGKGKEPIFFTSFLGRSSFEFEFECPNRCLFRKSDFRALFAIYMKMLNKGINKKPHINKRTFIRNSWKPLEGTSKKVSYP